MQLEQLGWVITVPAQEAIWPPFGLSDLARLDWTAIGAGLLYAPFVVLVTAAAAMMNVSGIELELKGDVDLNRELRSMGIGNVLSGLGAEFPAFPAYPPPCWRFAWERRNELLASSRASY